MIKIFDTGTLTTDVTGSATFTPVQGTLRINGLLRSIIVELDTATNPDVIVKTTIAKATNAKELLNVTALASTTQYRPRIAAQDTNGDNLTYDGTQAVPTLIDLDGKISVTVSNGGNAKTLRVIVYYE